MVHGDPRPTAHKHETAQNPVGGNGRLHTMRGERHHGPQTHGVWCRGRNMGMDPYTVSGNTQNGPETQPPWLAPGTKFPFLATTTSGDTVDPGESRVLPNEESENSVARGIYRLSTQSAVEDLSEEEEIGNSRQLFGDTIDITNANLPRTAQTGTSE